MRGFVDLHCHWVPGIDDGARTLEEGTAMLHALADLGFGCVVATPHMRPGMFDNQRGDLEQAFATALAALEDRSGLPELVLSSEHYFDDIVYQRVMDGQALPYPGERAILLEFYQNDFPPTVERQLFEIRRRRLLPVIAHPERYRCIWRSAKVLERLVELGSAALLDTAALVGKYGREPQRAAEELLELGIYHAACSDAHRPRDLEQVGKGMERVAQLYGQEEVEFLFRDGPRALLEGRIPE